MIYEISLKSTDKSVLVTADKFCCEDHTVFYLNSEEVARFETKNVKGVEQLHPLTYPKF